MRVDPNLLLVCKSSGMGDGEPDLGEKLMGAFFAMVLEQGQIPGRCIFMSTGVFLTTRGSPLLDVLQQLEAAGSQILSCGTCLEYYQRKEDLAVGTPTTMRDTVAAMLAAEKILNP